jgi:hypothetical protein
VWDTATEAIETVRAHLSHDMPCPRCGHAPHVYLACGDDCDCPTMWAGPLAEDVTERREAARTLST